MPQPRPAFLLEPGSLPVMPVWQTTCKNMHVRLFGAFRGPRDEAHPFHGIIAYYGCNLHYVPEFCGGMFLTAMNVTVFQYKGTSTTYGVRSTNTLNGIARDAGWGTMISTDDVMPWDQLVEKVAPIEPIGKVMWEYFGNRDPMATVAALSLCSRIVSWPHCQPSCRSNFTYWDRRDGATRTMLRWFTGVLGDGTVCTPHNMSDMHVSWASLEELPLTSTWLLPVHVTGATHPVYSRVGAHEDNAGYTNPNSGYNVITSTLYVENASRAHRPLINVRSVNTADERVRSFGWPLIGVPNNWSPM